MTARAVLLIDKYIILYKSLQVQPLPKNDYYYCRQHTAQGDLPFFKNRIHFDKGDIFINPEWSEKPSYLKGTVYILEQ